MYAAHGDWLILVQGNYVLQWFSADWNDKAAIRYSQ